MRPRPVQVLLFVLTAAVSWLGMMIVHEAGHVLHAWLSGGTVQRVVLHPLAISRTDVDPNPSPHFVAWGGAIWGCLLPIAAWWIVRRIGHWSRRLWTFFAGFCLITNGVYLGLGPWIPAGDAADLMQLGTPDWMLVLFGIVTIAAGLWLWHTLGPLLGFAGSASDAHSDKASPHDRRAAVWLFGILVLIVAAELLLSAWR